MRWFGWIGWWLVTWLVVMMINPDKDAAKRCTDSSFVATVVILATVMIYYALIP